MSMDLERLRQEWRKVDDQIQALYWAFTRQARAKPPIVVRPDLYARRAQLEALIEEKRMPSIPEHQRHTEKVQLRLDPKVVEAMDKLRGDLGRSEWLTYLVTKLASQPQAVAPRGTGKLF